MAKTDRAADRTDPRPVLNVAMVGHAFMGRAHGNAWRQANHFFDLPRRIVPAVIVGRDAARAAAAAQQLGFLRSTTDLDAVLADPEIHVVDVATPNDSHHRITMAALQQRKHVLCEKPMALTIEHSLEMAALARKQRVRTGVWHNYRRAPATALAARIVARGDLGDIRQVRAVYLQDWLRDPEAKASWRTSRKLCGSGAHGDLNAHLIDLVRALCGLEFDSVCGVQQTFTRQRPDGRPGIAADLKDRLREAGPHPGGQTGDARCLGVEDGRSEADQRHRNQHDCKALRMGQQDQPRPGRSHARRQRIGQGPPVGVKPDHRLQDGGGSLEDKGDQPDLREGQRKVFLQQRIGRRDQRLHKIVQKVPQRHRKDDGNNRGFSG